MTTPPDPTPPAQPSGAAAPAPTPVSAPASAPLPPPKALPPSRAGVWIAVLAAFWLGLTISAAAKVPAPTTLSLLVVGIGLLVLVCVWLATLGLARVSRRPIGLIGLLATPLAIAIAFLVPWHSIFLSARVNSRATELRQLAEKYAWIPVDKPRELSGSEGEVGGMAFVQVTRVRAGTALAWSTSGSGESGLLYSPGAADAREPEPPSWAKTHSARPAGPEGWWVYSWSRK